MGNRSMVSVVAAVLGLGLAAASAPASGEQSPRAGASAAAEGRTLKRPALEGRVLDPDGAPVEGADVDLGRG
ncbi:MAG: hypothetical protein AAGF23_13920, partial [Acidobacteriota bacterium]